MEYQSDNVLRVIEQMGGLIRRALDGMSLGGYGEPYELADLAIGLALDIDPGVIGTLSPQGLVSLLEIDNLDDRVVKLVGDALELQADVLRGEGELIASALRHDQAAAVRSLFDPNRAN